MTSYKKIGVGRGPKNADFVGFWTRRRENWKSWKVGFLDDESESAKISVVEGVNHTYFLVRGHHQKSVWVGCPRLKKIKIWSKISVGRILKNADFFDFRATNADFILVYQATNADFFLVYQSTNADFSCIIPSHPHHPRRFLDPNVWCFVNRATHFFFKFPFFRVIYFGICAV